MSSFIHNVTSRKKRLALLAIHTETPPPNTQKTLNTHKQSLSHKIIIWSHHQRQTHSCTRKSYGHARVHIASWWHTQSHQDIHNHRDTHSHTETHTVTRKHIQPHRSRQVPHSALRNSTPRSGLVSARPLIIRPRTLSSTMSNLLKYGRRRARRCLSGLV